QVAPLVCELEVGPADELVPGEIGVGGLRTGNGDEVAQRVRPEVPQEVTDVDDLASTGGELRPAHRQELARDNLIGQPELPHRTGLAAVVAFSVVAEQHA